MVSYYDFHGDKIIIGKELGRGGEGTVYEIEGKPELAAKIYHEKISPNKTEKLLRMKALQNEKLLRVTTWTVDVLRGNQNGEIVGFVMPKLKFGTAIHELYNPKSRRHFFPEADWRFLIHTATNLARAFSVVHLQGHAIGDVNHGNIVIAKDATVRLIDCDSYQLNAPRSENGENQSFLCEVGVSTHTPPELQGKSLRDVTRTENHDNFGLAVLIFQLLFMGRHPFSGKFLGEDETTLEDSIRENRFAYGDDAKSRKMQQPPATLALSAVSQAVAENFRRAFLSNENRPTALEWIAALEQMTAELQQCSVNASHFHLKESKKCPWCSLESSSGIAFYPTNLTGNFDIVTIGNLIDSIKPPLINNLPIKSSSSFITSALMPSPEVTRELKDLYLFYAIFLILVAFITLVVSTFILYEISLALMICGYFGCEKLVKNFIGELQENTQLKLDNARQKRNSFYDNLSGENLTKPFENLRGELKSTIKTYQNLPQEREFLIKKKGRQRYQRQLEIYLRNHRIEDSGLQGLNQAEIEILGKKNLVNAADIKKEKFVFLPNFNFALKVKLFDWRVHLEKTFVLELTDEMLRNEREEVEKEISEKRLHLETEIKSGLPRLQQNIKQVSINQKLLVIESEELNKNYEAATNDLQIVTQRQQYAIYLTILIAIVSFTIGTAIRTLTFNESYKAANYNRRMVLPEMTPNFSDYKIEPRGINVGETTNQKNANFVTSPISTNIPFDELYETGQKRFLSNKFDEAIVYFEAAKNKAPKNLNAYIKLGESYYAKSDYQNAAINFINAVALSPKSSDTHLVLGLTYLKLERKDDAIKSFKSAIETNPKLVIGYYHLGVTLKEIGQNQQAILYFQEGLKLKDGYELEFHKEMSTCYRNLGDDANAQIEFEKSQLAAKKIPSAVK